MAAALQADADEPDANRFDGLGGKRTVSWRCRCGDEECRFARPIVVVPATTPSFNRVLRVNVLISAPCIFPPVSSASY